MSSSGYFVKGVVVIVLMILAPVVGPLAFCGYLLFFLVRLIVREGSKVRVDDDLESTDEATADEFRK